MYNPKKPRKAFAAAVVASVVAGLGVILTEYADVVPVWILVVVGVLFSSFSTFGATYFVKNPEL